MSVTAAALTDGSKLSVTSYLSILADDDPEVAVFFFFFFGKLRLLCFFFFFFFWVTGEMSIPLWQEAFKDARRT
ncbi:hypothetical protein ABBQ38_005816 [Trebouxia sp. C0009 RCD-2024]